MADTALNRSICADKKRLCRGETRLLVPMGAPDQRCSISWRRALPAAGARPDQVAKITIYVVDYKSEYLPVIEQARVELFGDHKPADTLIGVARLARPEFLIEVDAIAVK
jgi:enamine deaminase RidA (YjgF/YER057c/UK114 family)